VSDKALHAGEKAKCPRAYWDWAPILERNKRGEFPYTPATSLLFGLRESLAMLNEEGLPNVFPAEYSNTLTAVLMPTGFDSDAYIAHAWKMLEVSLGVGLGEVKGKAFRIGHLGSLNELDLLGGLAGVELTLKSFGVNFRLGAGLAAAEEYLLETLSPR